MTETTVFHFDNWTEMRDGERACIWGNLEGIDKNGYIHLTDQDWASLILDMRDVKFAYPALKIFPLQTLLCWRVERTEDALIAIACWTPGGVPVPLIRNRQVT